MILNTYALLLGFVALLRLLAGVAALGLGAAALRSLGLGDHHKPDERRRLEDRSYLVILLTLLLVVLNLVSWPLLYLLLQSYVAEWPGVMCIYGVTRIGEGSVGPSRFLPNLLTFLQFSKPALVFLSGAWFVIYWLNRQTRTGPLLPRLFMLVSVLGLFAVVDAGSELAYLATPKKEEMPSGGCCTAVFERADAERFLPARMIGDVSPARITWAFYGCNLLLIAGLLVLPRWTPSVHPIGLLVLLLWNVFVVLVSAWFLIDVLAPALLQLPHHHCPYDLIAQAPEAVVAVTLFLFGCLFLGWAAVARWGGRIPETDATLPNTVRLLLRFSLLCFVCAGVMASLEMALA